MGSFRATLELGGKEYDVLYSNYEFSRNTDSKGKPSSSISGGRVSVTVESTEDTTAIEAMLNSQFKAVDGKIIYKKTEEDAKMKEIEFKNAYIVHYKETLDTTTDDHRHDILGRNHHRGQRRVGQPLAEGLGIT